MILLDEPFSGLNPAESKRLSHALARINKARGIAMVLVEHDVEIVFGLSERVFVLDFGVIIAAGTPAEIQRDPAVRAAYLGDMSPARGWRPGTPCRAWPGWRRTLSLAAGRSPAGMVPGPGRATTGPGESSEPAASGTADASTALHEVSFSVARRSVTALLGPNGAGKSTSRGPFPAWCARSRA